MRLIGKKIQPSGGMLFQVPSSIDLIQIKQGFPGIGPVEPQVFPLEIIF